VKPQELARRREALIVRAQAQRDEFARYNAQFEAPVRAAETVLGFLNILRRSPLAITGLTALLVRTPWRRLSRIPKWAWRGWKVVKFVRNLVT
jgi:hypothetical protein